MANDLGEVEQLSLPSELLFDDFSIIGEDRPNKSLYCVTSSSSEGEEEEVEDNMAGLTRKMVSSFSLDEEPPREVAGSPQSTLCSWLASPSKGSSDGGDSPVDGRRRQQGEANDSWDRDELLSEAAGQVIQINLNHSRHHWSFNESGLFGTDPTSLAPVVAGSQMLPGKKTAGTGYFVSPILTHRQLQAEQFYRLKQLQLMKQNLRSGGRGAGGHGSGRSGRLVNLSPTAWPPLQKQQQQMQPPPAAGMGNGMRTAFLKSSGARKEPAGTGVFLPRTPGCPATADPPKNPSCSTVLVPAKVVQALDLNLGRLASKQYYSGSSGGTGGFLLDHDATLSRRKYSQSSASDRQAAVAVAGAAAAGTDFSGGEICLPQEWTY